MQIVFEVISAETAALWYGNIDSTQKLISTGFLQSSNQAMIHKATKFDLSTASESPIQIKYE